MVHHVVEFLSVLPKELIVITLGALPVSELRGAIPVGFALGLTPLEAYMFGFAGNILPIIPLLFFLEPVSNRLRRFPVFKKFFDWLFERTKKKAKLIERFEALGLILFVAVPLPVTGAWTGCVAATLFKVRFRYAFFAICLGVALAGLIVTGLCLAGMRVYSQ